VNLARGHRGKGVNARGQLVPRRRARRQWAASLAAATILFAACSSGSTPSRSVTPPTRTPPTVATTPLAGVAESGFVAFGDFGGGEAQAAVAQQVTAWAATHRVDALVTTGDNVYPDGDPSLYAAQLDAPYAELRQTRPFWLALGNHDVQAGHGEEELSYVGLPATLPFTTDLPGAQLLFLDANHPDAQQAAWLNARLSEPGPPLRIVIFHQPAFACALHGSTAAVDEQWVSVLEGHRVPLVLNGHDHYYERFVSSSDVTYVVTGGGGQGLYQRRATCTGVPPSKATAQRHHFTGVEIHGTTITLTAVADDGTVIDRATITR
jgi:Calcineurin-like phosphoesterase